MKGVFVVEAEAAAQFMHDVSKANTAEAGLHLLSAVLGRQNACREAVAATEANVLQVHEASSCFEVLNCCAGDMLQCLQLGCCKVSVAPSLHAAEANS